MRDKCTERRKKTPHTHSRERVRRASESYYLETKQNNSGTEHDRFDVRTYMYERIGVSVFVCDHENFQSLLNCGAFCFFFINSLSLSPSIYKVRSFVLNKTPFERLRRNKQTDYTHTHTQFGEYFYFFIFIFAFRL